ncbi:MAG: hypothetical protein HZA36_00625 [Parcubacteria group bacterium]|nr:hypothetical protein [Parcubacteria group bacterium]
MLPEPDRVNNLINDLDCSLGALDYPNLGPEQQLRVLREYEHKVDNLVHGGKVSVEESWDAYFGLLHEYDLLEAWGDRKRVLKNIDTKRYNPLESKNFNVVLIAHIRLGNNR